MQIRCSFAIFYLIWSSWLFGSKLSNYLGGGGLTCAFELSCSNRSGSTTAKVAATATVAQGGRGPKRTGQRARKRVIPRQRICQSRFSGCIVWKRPIHELPSLSAHISLRSPTTPFIFVIFASTSQDSSNVDDFLKTNQDSDYVQPHILDWNLVVHWKIEGYVKIINGIEHIENEIFNISRRGHVYACKIYARNMLHLCRRSLLLWRFWKD